MLRGDVLDLDILPSDWVSDNSPILAWLPYRDVVTGFSALFESGLGFCISALLVSVETVDELLDVGDAVSARVVRA